MNLIFLISSYFFIITSIIGFGFIFKRILNNKIILEFEFILLGVLLFLISLSFFTHFFFKHGYIHNLIILVFGFISYLKFYLEPKKIFFKNYNKYIFLIFLILIISLLTVKSHDDFPYYHFPYTFYLTQENLIIGIGSLNHGFRTPSSIFYLNSLFYIPIIKHFTFNFGAVLFLGISNLILILKLKDDYKKKNYDFVFILTLLCFIFINIFFYRISEHGTDRSAQILIFILFIEILSLTRKKIDFVNFFSKIFIILALTISLKAFYVLYLIVLIPIFLFFKNISFIKLIKSFFINIYFYLFLLTGIFLMVINTFNSGCFLYPVSFTCFENIEWTLANEAKLMNDWYEQWAKAGAGPNFRVEDPENYIKNLNWVENWFKIYFINKVSDYLLGLILLSTIVFFIFYSKKKKKIELDNKIFWIYSIILILFLEWFYNHPSLRYGGYSLIALMLFLPLSILISSFDLKKFLKFKLIFLIILTLTIFTGRNISRLVDEAKKYGKNPIKDPLYKLEKNNFRIDTFIKKIKQNYKTCLKQDSINCNIYEGIYINKKNNHYYLIKKK